MGSPEIDIVVTTLADVVDVVSSLTANDAAVVAVLDHMLRSRTARRRIRLCKPSDSIAAKDVMSEAQVHHLAVVGDAGQLLRRHRVALDD